MVAVLQSVTARLELLVKEARAVMATNLEHALQAEAVVDLAQQVEQHLQMLVQVETVLALIHLGEVQLQQGRI